MTVIFTNPAVDDLQPIREFLAQHAEALAERTIERIMNKADLLRNGFPDFGQVEPLLAISQPNLVTYWRAITKSSIGMTQLRLTC